MRFNLCRLTIRASGRRTGRNVQGTRFLPHWALPVTMFTGSSWHGLIAPVRDESPVLRPPNRPRLKQHPSSSTGSCICPTPLGRVIALDPSTGRERWIFDPHIGRDIPYRWFQAAGACRRRLDEKAPLDAACRTQVCCVGYGAIPVNRSECGRRTACCTKFGSSGIVDLRQGLRIPPFETQAYTVTSPPVVANGLVVVGSSIGDNSRPNPASGEIRAFDARTGALRWSWDPIPQNPADPAYGEWRGDLAHGTGAANAWSALSADPQRDLVFIPTSSPAPDYYGVLRLGDNRHANSIVALKLSTGDRVWTFQTVHHDLWDYDNAAPPALVTLTRDGAEIPAVLQATKTGMLFVLNRETGEPIFPVEERSVPKSDIPGEEAAATQPFTALTPPLSPHRLAAVDAWGINDADREACRAVVDGLRNDGIFTPPSTQGTLVLPSNIGGAHWGGVAVDPVRQIAVVPVNRIAAMVQLIPRADFDRDRFRTEDTRLGHNYEYNRMLGTPYVMRRRILLGPSGLPCSPPPWGTLVAVDLKTGRIRWETPLGSFTRPLGPDMASRVKEEWGSPNLGGPIATAGGVVFIGAALDRWLRAYDIETGRELWRGPLPESARATPMSYQLRSGEQFVVIAVGGGDLWGKGDHLIAFRLPSAR